MSAYGFFVCAEKAPKKGLESIPNRWDEIQLKSWYREWTQLSVSLSLSHGGLGDSTVIGSKSFVFHRRLVHSNRTSHNTSIAGQKRVIPSGAIFRFRFRKSLQCTIEQATAFKMLDSSQWFFQTLLSVSFSEELAIHDRQRPVIPSVGITWFRSLKNLQCTTEQPTDGLMLDSS